MATKRENTGVINRVHRPQLTAAEQALAAQYQPKPCPCRHEGQWLMETRKAGEDLEFYCTGCGKVTRVPPT